MGELIVPFGITTARGSQKRRKESERRKVCTGKKSARVDALSVPRTGSRCPKFAEIDLLNLGYRAARAAISGRRSPLVVGGVEGIGLLGHERDQSLGGLTRKQGRGGTHKRRERVRKPADNKGEVEKKAEDATARQLPPLLLCCWFRTLSLGMAD